MKMKCSLETAVVMVVGLSLVSQAAQPGIHRAAGQKTQLGKAPVSPCHGLERRLLLTSGDGGHLDCTQMEGSVSDVGGSDAGDLLVSVPRMNVERTSSPPLPANLAVTSILPLQSSVPAGLRNTAAVFCRGGFGDMLL